MENAVLLDTVVSSHPSGRKLEGTTWMHSMYSLVEHDGKNSLVKMFAEEAISPKSGEIFTRAYSLKYIQKIAEIDNGVLSSNGGLTDSHSTTISIAELYQFVKQFDKDLRQPQKLTRLY